MKTAQKMTKNTMVSARISIDRKDGPGNRRVKVNPRPISSRKAKARYSRFKGIVKKQGFKELVADQSGITIPEDRLGMLVCQVRSAIGQNKRTRQSLSALGIKGWKTKEHKWTPREWGNVQRVSHLVDVVLFDQKTRNFFTPGQKGGRFADTQTILHDRKMLAGVLTHGLKSPDKEGTMQEKIENLLQTADRLLQRQKQGGLSDWERHAGSIVIDRALHLVKNTLPRDQKRQLGQLVVKMGIIEGVVSGPVPEFGLSNAFRDVAKHHSAKYLIHSDLKAIDESKGKRYQLVISFDNKLTNIFKSGDVVELDGPEKGTRFTVQVFGTDILPEETEVNWVFNGDYSQHFVDITPLNKNGLLEVYYLVDGCDMGVEKLKCIP